MGCTTGSDIKEYNYAVSKANNNDLEVIVYSNGFRLIRNSDGICVGNVSTVDALFQYVCGYETGLDKGLVDSCRIDDQEW